MRFLIPHYLEYHATERPGAPALEYRGEQLNYAELLSQANRLANSLVALGVACGDRVGIHMDKCLETGVALHGIMQAGAAYVPLDPFAPPTRVAEMVNDCGINVIISGASKRGKLAEMAGLLQQPLRVIGIDSAGDEPYECFGWERILADHHDRSPGRHLIESDLAYIIYTSGSTGKPKGIMHTHHSSLSYARWAVSEYALQDNDRLGNHAALHFDISIFDFIAGLVAGAYTVIIPDETLRFPASYSQLLADSQLTILFTVPFALIQLCQRGVLEQCDLSRLRLIIFGGEPMPPKYLRRLQELLPRAQLDNMYGPAEVNGVTHYTVPAGTAAGEAIPIGPISRIAQALVVDEQLNPVTPGDSGELLVRTPTMMQGYWRRPDLDKKAFYRAAGDGAVQRRYYRTGDLVREDDSGTLWFLGRGDRQVKVRGYRVELDEVEAALASHPAVEAAAAYTVAGDEGAIEIGSTIIPVAGRPVEPGELQRYLKRRLPVYAVPGRISVVEDLPRTATGKIDRRTLSRSNSL